MSNQDVLMDYEAVAQVAIVFNDASEAFQTLLPPLGSVAQQLAGQAYIGQTGRAAADGLARIQESVNRLVRRCEEMHGDIRTAMQNYQAGDQEGAESFDE
jgi:WXG100 family type VII secretion target